MVVLVAVLALFQWFAVGQWWHVPVGWVFYPAWVYAAVCVLAKRLHDRGRSGWWAAGVLIGFNFIWPYPDSLVGAAGLIVIIWAAVELGWMKGEEGRTGTARPSTPDRQGLSRGGSSDAARII
ncbi:DUF805 domain-containing protein [Brevundimonas denitrificans]|uniref:DUF805 domain-containing protein n=1 Tax=Brevundimonas denitrificans TaxID=1443434 RepID=UPI0021E3D9E7|nr:DUF805 domain-containing protein [Brevundimonas denitrificans]